MYSNNPTLQIEFAQLFLNCFLLVDTLRQSEWLYDSWNWDWLGNSEDPFQASGHTYLGYVHKKKTIYMELCTFNWY